jgi:hypothetical protein
MRMTRVVDSQVARRQPPPTLNPKPQTPNPPHLLVVEAGVVVRELDAEHCVVRARVLGAQHVNEGLRPCSRLIA